MSESRKPFTLAETRVLMSAMGGQFPKQWDHMRMDICRKLARLDKDLQDGGSGPQMTLREAATNLVVLKDGPRDAHYEESKTDAWEALREALKAQ